MVSYVVNQEYRDEQSSLAWRLIPNILNLLVVREAKRNNMIAKYFAGFPNILLPCVQEDSSDWTEDTAGGT